MLVGVPQGISDSVESLSKAATNPAATYDAIKQLITSDDMFSVMSDAVKQSYIDRINLMESEYQRAGAGGAYNAGLEAGKLMSDLITAVAGGVGVAKTGTVLTEKIVAKVTSKVDKVIPENPKITWTAGDGEYSVKPGKDIKDVEYPGGQYDGNSLPKVNTEGAAATNSAAHNAANYAGLKMDLKTTEAANEVVESLRNTGQLPKNYVDKTQAMSNGWKPGKALNNTTPGGQLGGDVFENSTNILPSAPRRVWREADIGLDNTMSRANQAGTRLLYSDDGLLYITTDHYKTATSIGTWK